MALPDGLAALFRLTPDRASAYLAAKGLQLSGPYWELDGPAHSRNFTVANLAKLDVLADIKAAVQGAMDQGQTERWFKQQLVDTLKAKGWWGPTVSVDPVTGEARMMQQGSLRRLQTIYRTNLQSAYMAGRHAQALEQADRAPFAQYLAVRDSRSRPSHAALHDKVFRLDSPEWSIISPPNGYNCRCRARYMSQRELDKRGLKVEGDASLLERTPEKVPVDPLTGESPERIIERGVSVPSRTKPGERDVLWADRGWDHLPGSDGAERALVDRLMGGAREVGGGMREAVVANIWRAPRKPLDPGAMLPECDGGAASFTDGEICLSPRPDQPTYRDLGRPDLRDPAIRRQVAPHLLPRAATRIQALATLESVLGVDAANPSRIVRTPLEPVVIARGWLPNVVEKEADGRERYAHFIVPTLEDPFEVWNVLYTDGGVRRRYIGLFEGTADLMVVVRENLDGSLFWNVMQAKSKKMNGHRLGYLAYGK